MQGATREYFAAKAVNEVSIHAPMQGATLELTVLKMEIEVSIHAPMQGATRPIGSPKKQSRFQSTPLCKGRHFGFFFGISGPSFNPRPYARGDPILDTLAGALKGFNPRPYARGDYTEHVNAKKRRGFNPRPYARGDPRLMRIWRNVKKFQSTPLCKGRLSKRIDFVFQNCFNPRPYARGDKALKSKLIDLTVSIHAPMQGATSRHTILVHPNLFQSTPLCKGRHSQN